MTVEIVRNGDNDLIKVEGRVDTLTSHDFDARVLEIDPIDKDVVIDCSDMEYISSAGLRSFISLLKKVKGAGHTLEVVNVTSAVRPVFDMTGFSTLFNLK